ncbi:MAG: DotU family type IV/VI secretion system protein [Myxococcales bacterium]|nr:DotU family type IV/VI secretion system protein [Myxococcales bacterium]
MDWLLRAATPALEIAGELLRGVEARDGEGLRARAETALAGLSPRSTVAAPEEALDTADARLALAALLDELAVREQGALAASWRRRSLLAQRYVHANLTTAGDGFFDRLDELLAAPRTATNLSVLRIFGLCLELGFRGRYGAHERASAGDLDEVRAQVRRRLGTLAARPPRRPPPRLHARSPRQRPPLLWPLAGVLALALTLGTLLRGHHLADALEDVTAHVDEHRARTLEETR